MMIMIMMICKPACLAFSINYYIKFQYTVHGGPWLGNGECNLCKCWNVYSPAMLQSFSFLVYLTMLSVTQIIQNRMKGWGVNWKGCGRKRSWPNCMLISRHSLGGTGEKHEKPVCGQRFEPGTSLIRRRRVNHWTTKFSLWHSRKQ
jgi:hypothetical protein